MNAGQHVTNEAFLRAVFGGVLGADDAHVTGFTEDPESLGRDGKAGFWSGTKWSRAKAWRDGLPGQNSYVCISTFDDDVETGRARRTKRLFRTCWAIVVDDVGTKVTDVTKLGPPSWALETSPGNFQWGYRLETPERDARRVTTLVDGMIARGLATDGQDPGMKGVTRYVRLPEGRNWKKKHGGFRCVLREWHPERVFGLDEMAGWWGIVLPVAGLETGLGGAGGGTARASLGIADDEMLRLLDGWGMLLGGRTGDGTGFHCVCPWQDRHTEAIDTGTAYWPPGVQEGGFKCHHGHCGDRNWRDLERWADARIQEESGGLARIGSLDFPIVPGWTTAPRNLPSIEPVPVGRDGVETGRDDGEAGAGTEAERAFFGDLVFVMAEDKFFSLRSGDLVTRAAVDLAWGRELTQVLPVVSPRTGETMRPSVWFQIADNRRRARVVDRLTYWPGQGRYVTDGDGIRLVNKWAGAAERLGLGTVTDGEVGEWLRLVDHVCSKDGPAVRDLLLDWMALVVGAPGLKPGWHVMIEGRQGLGKDLISKPIVYGVGARINTSSVNSTQLAGSFNAWAEARFCKIHELTRMGPDGGAGQYTTLKELTENGADWLKVNQKNQREYYVRNVVAFFGTSNEERALALEAADRRFLVIMAGETDKWPAAEYAALRTWFARGGDALCAEWLAQRWDAISTAPARVAALMGSAPGSTGKAQMIRANEDPVMTWMREQIESGAWHDLISGREIGLALAAEAKAGSSGFTFAPGPSRWGPMLRALGGEPAYRGMPVTLRTGEQVRMWVVRNAARFTGAKGSDLARNYARAKSQVFEDGVTTATIIPLQTSRKPEPEKPA